MYYTIIYNMYCRYRERETHTNAVLVVHEHDLRDPQTLLLVQILLL